MTKTYRQNRQLIRLYDRIIVCTREISGLFSLMTHLATVKTILPYYIYVNIYTVTAPAALLSSGSPGLRRKLIQRAVGQVEQL